MAAKFFTGLPLDGRTRSACMGTARLRWPPSRRVRRRRSATPRLPGTGPGFRCPRPSASVRRPAPDPVELAGATWHPVEATPPRTVLAVPLGSLEQHGPHLPLDTDSRIAGAVAAGLAARCTASPWRLPCSGSSGEHADFPGTLLLGQSVLSELLVELVRSARPSFAGVVFVTAHGGNEEALLGQRRCTARVTMCSCGER